MSITATNKAADLFSIIATQYETFYTAFISTFDPTQLQTIYSTFFAAKQTTYEWAQLAAL